MQEIAFVTRQRSLNLQKVSDEKRNYFNAFFLRSNEADPDMLSIVLCMQDASSLLYLCVMLRKQPRVENAIVTIVNGSRFFDIYIPSLGLEARININEILPAVEATWNTDLRYDISPEVYITIFMIIFLSEIWIPCASSLAWDDLVELQQCKCFLPGLI